MNFYERIREHQIKRTFLLIYIYINIIRVLIVGECIEYRYRDTSSRRQVVGI